MAKVLLVDDDPDQLEVRGLVMDAKGHQVERARTCSEAVALFRNWGPDIVLMDVRLPRREDGIQLVLELRGLSTSVPILILSGWPDDLAKSPALPLVSEVVRKPVRTEALLDLVERLTA